MLSDDEIKAIDPGKYYNDINFARAVEAAVLVKQAAQTVEPVAGVLDGRKFSIGGPDASDVAHGWVPLYTIAQLLAGVAAARVQALEEAHAWMVMRHKAQTVEPVADTWKAGYRHGAWSNTPPATAEAIKLALEALARFHLWADSQADAQSKGGHETFDLMQLREERDACEAAIAAIEEVM